MGFAKHQGLVESSRLELGGRLVGKGGDLIREKRSRDRQVSEDYIRYLSTLCYI